MQSDKTSLLRIPYDFYRQMRDTNPVAYDERFKIWNVYRYNDALHVLAHPEIYSSEPQQNYQPRLPSILGLDPPRHRMLRNIVSQAFTPRIVTQLEPRITAVTNLLLDKVILQGEMDVVRDLAYPLPITIIAELLGVPAEEQATFREWSNNLVTGPRYDGTLVRPEERIRAIRELDDYFRRKLEERRQTPRADLISSLVTAEVDGEHLSEEELLEFCRLLLIAGHETTANLIGNAMVCFEEHPDAMEDLRSNPTLMPGAVEEILRCHPSVAGAVRSVKENTTLGDKELKKYDTVSIWVTSTNRDERQFADPEKFDIRRNPNRHLTFGYGIHFCLGAPLARIEARIALTLMLQRLPDMKRISDQPIEPISSPFILGVKSFPLSFHIE